MSTASQFFGRTASASTTKWNRCRCYSKAGTYSFTVPALITELMLVVIGGGGSGACVSGNQATGGGGGGFAMGVYDCTPGETLPTITVGAGGAAISAINNGIAGGTSSIGTLLSATGGGGGLWQSSASTALSGGSGGTGSVDVSLRDSFTATGGRGGNKSTNPSGSSLYTGGGASGSVYGTGGNGGDIISANNTCFTGGGAWGGGNGGNININNATACYTGGGGIGNSGGSITNANSSYKIATGGGGSRTAGESPSYGLVWSTSADCATKGGAGFVCSGGKPIFGTSSFYNGVDLARESFNFRIQDLLIYPDMVYNMSGGSGGCLFGYSRDGGIGGGSGATVYSSLKTGSGNGGFGAGSGASDVVSGSGGFGGGGGSGANAGYLTICGNGGTGGGGAAANDNAKYSGSGGDGFVMIAWTEAA